MPPIGRISYHNELKRRSWSNINWWPQCSGGLLSEDFYFRPGDKIFKEIFWLMKNNFGVWVDFKQHIRNCDSLKETNFTRQIRHNQQRNKCTQGLFKNSTAQYYIISYTIYARYRPELDNLSPILVQALKSDGYSFLLLVIFARIRSIVAVFEQYKGRSNIQTL